MFIAFVNKSTKVTNDQCQLIAEAINWQVRWHICPAWQKSRPAVVYLADESQAPAGSYILGVFDNSDQQGVLGWHTEDDKGNVFGRIFASPSLDAGYQVLQGPYSVAATASHEVAEAICDPTVSDWSMAGDGTLFAKESADPVEADYYSIHVGKGKTEVSVSNFVFPSWFDPQGHAPFDQMGRLTAPFTMSKGGYYVYQSPGSTQPQQRFDDEMPDWKKETKQSSLSRTMRRLPA